MSKGEKRIECMNSPERKLPAKESSCVLDTPKNDNSNSPANIFMSNFITIYMYITN